MPAHRLLPRLIADGRGVTVVEFAIVAPVMSLLLIGGFDVAHTLYIRAAMEGVIQKAGRDSSLETADDAARQRYDDTVRSQARALAGRGAKVDITRRSFRTFSSAQARRPEEWTDTNRNRRCDANEPYVDANDNGTWDADGGNSAQGGAKDKTIYAVAVTYPRMFPLNRMIGGSGETSITATTVLQNQPYAEQSAASTQVRNCP